MKHITRMTRQQPAKAQFEPLLQIVGLLGSLMGLLQQAATMFGLTIPQKGGTQA